ncbi:MAG: YebC/PmpR family DNA-binding transcriptional regulator [Anaerolineae bacterium]|jgi:YebC/PmpR family DNA-binding regulatory protein|nr:YebC/PmpR family DNA-binding transcriptional regulator [Anaerolineae bacterium]
MSGHSKWSTIKRKKGAEDAKRGKIFTRITREIVMAAREGGGDYTSNFRLRLAVDKARSENMPKDNIERAIKRGLGEDKDGSQYEEITYEGYANAGAALIIECVTENRNRTVAEVRHVLSRAGGSLGESGSVAWQFTQKAYFTFPLGKKNFDELFMLAADGGADDIIEEEGNVEVFGPASSFKTLSNALHNAGISPETAELRMFPNQELELNLDDTLKVLKTIDHLEELDDVQNVYVNVAISDEALESLDAA